MWDLALACRAFYAGDWGRRGGSDLLAIRLMLGFGGLLGAERSAEGVVVNGRGGPSRAGSTGKGNRISI